MGMANPEPTYFSADMVRALIDEASAWPRYETIYGELHVTPAPRWSHQLVVGRVHVGLANYLAREGVGIVLVSPADISWGRDDVLVQPDVFVVPIDQARAVHQENAWTLVRRLLLAVEVLSPSSARYDRFTKRALYQQMGVPLYWVLDPERREVEVWTPERHFPEVERERLAWHPDGADEPRALDLAALFAPP
jgi:Uma2 family endonuclease